MTHYAKAAGLIDQVGFESDEAASGHQSFNTHFIAMVAHGGDLRLSPSEVFHDSAHGFLRDFQEKLFNRFEQVPVTVFAINDFRAGHQDLVAFTAHLSDQDGDLHSAAASYVEDVGSLCLLDPQSYICAHLFDEAFPNMASCYQLTVDACQRTVIDGKLHLDRWRVNWFERERHAVHRIGNGFTDENILETGQTDDVAGMGFGNFNPFKAFEVENRGNLRLALSAIAVNTDRAVPHFDFAAVDLTKRDSAEVIRVIEIGDEQTEAFSRVGSRRRDVLDDRVEKRLHRSGHMFEVGLCVAFFCAREN